ncbi:hypothetical protein ABW19_dt0207558 [Dactylella cylindrospora]|nr:hypothetical protein ABW19_dt0207558 [Dactylella cylindrospora]
MPPAGKGKGKSRGGGGSSSTNRGRSRSRNTTPASMNDHSSSVSELAADRRDDADPATYANVFSQFLVSADSYSSSTQQAQVVPAISSLDQLLRDLSDLREQADKRRANVERKLVKLESKAERLAKEEEEKKADGARSEKEEKKKKKDRTMSTESNTHRPHAIGAHTTTAQAPSTAHIKEEPDDGRSNMKKRKASNSLEVDDVDSQPAKSPKREAPEDEEPASDEEEEQPPPMATLLIAEELSNDPADYEIGAVTSETTVEEKRKIFSVAHYPMVDISDLLPGDAPDEDFSRAKPNSQIAMNTFAGYIEPYFRPYTEEDLAFLRERGDRVTPYIIPNLGRPYKEVWDAEDGVRYDSTTNDQEHVALGKPDDLKDDVLTKNSISLGPLLGRVMAGLVVEDLDEPTAASGAGLTNGASTGLDVIMENAESTSGMNGVANGIGDEHRAATLRPVAATSLNLPEGIIAPKDWKISANRPEFASLEERIRQEMIYMGMVGPSDTFHFNEKQDDEVSARLRELQAELRVVSIRNGARKARLAELLKEQLAYQEYATILDDLDKQVDQAYLKRTRGMKAKKKKPFGAHHNANAAQTARPGIGDMARTLMERRRKWKDTVGPVFDKEVTRIPTKTIFDEDIMKGLEAKEAAGEGLEED